VFALLAELEALASAVLCTVGINLDGVITDSYRARTAPTLQRAVVALATTRAVVLCLATATAAVAHVITFVVVVPTTAFIPFDQVHYFLQIQGFKGAGESLPSINIIPYLCLLLHNYPFIKQKKAGAKAPTSLLSVVELLAHAYDIVAH
jgi:hypothetical protein